MRRRRSGGGGLSRVTMLDVAKHAGVSAQTVSRVIGRPELVTDDTRKKVFASVKALGYIPNEAARNLASSRTRTVAVIIPTLASSAYAAELRCIIEVVENAGISVVIGNSEYSAEREERLVRSMLQWRPLGFVITGLSHTKTMKDLLKSSGVPVIETWDTDGERIDMAVGFSNIAVGRDVAALFVSSGKKRIAFVGGNRDQDSRASGRYEGLARGLQEAGFPKPLRVELPLPMSAEDGVRGLDEVFRQAPLTEAIMFSADSIALGALLECTRRGVRVPEQLAICGVGNYELSRLVSPALTTVEVHVEEMGRRSAEQLLALTEGERPDNLTIELTPKLIRRGSA